METRRQLAASMKGFLLVILLLGIVGMVFWINESPHITRLIELFFIWCIIEGFLAICYVFLPESRRDHMDRITIVYLRVVYGDIWRYTEETTVVHCLSTRRPYTISLFLCIRS
jgi:hypothetical protein